jgi:hypothetical protein
MEMPNYQDREKIFLNNQEYLKQEKISDLRSQSDINLKIRLLEEKSRFNREMSAHLSQLEKELKKPVLQYKKQAFEEYNLVSKNLRNEFERDIADLNNLNFYKEKLQFQKQLLLDEIETNKKAKLAEFQNELSSLKKSSSQSDYSKEEFSSLLYTLSRCKSLPDQLSLQKLGKLKPEVEAYIKKEQVLIAKYNETVEGMRQNAKEGTLEFVQKIKDDYYQRLQKEREFLKKQNEVKEKDVTEQRRKMLKAHEAAMNKLEIQGKSSLEYSLNNLKEDHQDTLKSQKELISLRLQNTTEALKNNLKLDLLSKQRENSQKLDSLSTTSKSKLTSSLSSFESSLEKSFEPNQAKLLSINLSSILNHSSALSTQLSMHSQTLLSLQDDFFIVCKEKQSLLEKIAALDGSAYDRMVEEQSIPEMEEGLEDKQKKLKEVEGRVAKLYGSNFRKKMKI